MKRWEIGIVVWFVAAACFADATRDLHLAARSGDLETVKRLVEGGLPADSPGRFGITALSLAAQGGSSEVWPTCSTREPIPTRERRSSG